MADAPNPFQMRLHINLLGYGFTETYTLQTDSFAASLPIARNICLYRRAFMCLGCSMVYASVVRLGAERKRRKCIDGAIGPHPFYLTKVGLTTEDQWYPNHQDDCYWYDLETATGEVARKPIRGIPDQWYNKRSATIAPPNAYPVGSPLIVGPTDMDASIGTYQASFLAYVRDNTQWHSPIEDEAPFTYLRGPWASITYDKAGRKKSGRPFGLSPGRARSV